MKIKIEFLNGTIGNQLKVRESAQRASEVLSDPEFIEKVRSHSGFDFTNHTPGMVAATLENVREVAIKVGFYREWWPWSKVIAYEENGEVWFNTRKAEAGDVGNVAHETMHAMGFSHNGNAASGNQNTIPYWIGEQVAAWPVKPPVCTPRAEVEAVTPS